MERKISLDAPNVGLLEAEYVIKALRENYISTYGPYVGEFEKKFSQFVGSSYAVSVQSGTAALHMALHELGIKEGDEVIVPVLTFVATVNPVVYVGATPVFVDVDIETWNIDVESLENAITPRTKAIIPVHLYGNPANMDTILEISHKYGIYVIEDATESLGATWKGQYTGTFGIFGAFSFNGNKVITTGGGGMLVTDDGNRASHVKFLINQARDATKGYYHPEVGFNYRMTNLEASLGLAQLERLPYFLEKKNRFYQIYKDILGDIKGVVFQREYEDGKSSHWLVSIRLDDGINMSIETFQHLLKERGIPTRRIFMPLVEFPPYRQYKTDAYHNAYLIYERGINLPSSTLNSSEDIEWVAKQIWEVLEHAS